MLRIVVVQCTAALRPPGVRMRGQTFKTGLRATLPPKRGRIGLRKANARDPRCCSNRRAAISRRSDSAGSERSDSPWRGDGRTAKGLYFQSQIPAFEFHPRRDMIN